MSKSWIRTCGCIVNCFSWNINVVNKSMNFDQTKSNMAFWRKYDCCSWTRLTPRGRCPRRAARGGSIGAGISMIVLSKTTRCLPSIKVNSLVAMSFMQGKRGHFCSKSTKHIPNRCAQTFAFFQRKTRFLGSRDFVYLVLKASDFWTPLNSPKFDCIDRANLTPSRIPRKKSAFERYIVTVGASFK